jgi:cAMP-dependent protein kinase regulator
MTLPEAYQKEIKALDQKILQSNPSDILQFCADYFSSRLASERAAFVAEAAPSTTDKVTAEEAVTKDMSSGPFTSPFGANSNPFGSSDAQSGSIMQRVIEEEEADTVTSPTTPSFGLTSGTAFRGPFGGDSSMDAPPSALRSPPNPESYPAQYNFARRTSVSAESLKPSADTSDNWTPPYHEKTPDQLQRLQKAIENNFLFSHMDDEQGAQILGALVEKPIPAKDIKVSIT